MGTLREHCAFTCILSVTREVTVGAETFLNSVVKKNETDLRKYSWRVSPAFFFLQMYPFLCK